MKKNFFLQLLLIVWLFFGLISSAFSQDGQNERPVMVRVAVTEKGEAFPTADMIGSLYFDRISRVSSEEEGKVSFVGFREGDKVKKGQILFRLSSKVLETQLAMEQARLSQVKIRLESSRLKLDRLTRLLKKNVVTESAYDDVRFSHAALEKELVILSRQVDILSIRLSNHVIKAPFDGIILAKQTEIGEWIVPGTPLCSLASSSDIYVQVSVGENFVPYVKEGDKFDMTLNALNRQLTGRVECIMPLADPKTKNILVKLHVNYEGLVIENMSVLVKVPVSEARDVVVMPRNALIHFQGQDMVYIIDKDKAVPLSVSLVDAWSERVGVVGKGLIPGMTVIVEGNERLAPGQTVVIQGGKS